MAFYLHHFDHLLRSPLCDTMAPALKARVLFDYEPLEDGQLALTEGEIIQVVQRDANGWWVGKSGGNQGFFPESYVELALQATAEWDFAGEGEDELVLKEGKRGKKKKKDHQQT